jgi:putative addiction module killer protein
LFEVRRTQLFIDWLDGLRDARAVAKIAARLKRVSEGNLGDWASVGERVSELRIHYGPGYRVYFTRRGNEIVVILAGGDKSTQTRDIEFAKAIEKDLAL